MRHTTLHQPQPSLRLAQGLGDLALGFPSVTIGFFACRARIAQPPRKGQRGKMLYRRRKNPQSRKDQHRCGNFAKGRGGHQIAIAHR